MSTPDASVLEVLKSFIADHPELLPELAKAAETAAEKVPLTVYDLFHTLVGQVKNIDDERREQLHAAVDEHQAQHEALLAAAPAASPEPAPAEVTPPPAPAPVSVMPSPNVSVSPPVLA